MNQLNQFKKNTAHEVQKDKKSDQFEYLGRWVDKKHFRAFVYDKNENQKLAESYDEFQSLIASGLWFASKPDASKIRKQKHDSVCPAG